jgi:S-DNA-T family DNA segregation ATPase FtsK/SpoIIIE
MNNGPDTLRLLLVDPKRVELVQFNNIPHLLGPVLFDVEKVIAAIKWITREMERRYRLFSKVGARNLKGYNRKLSADEDPLPYIVVFVDELAELMMVAPDEVERYICRIAQLARATGIHLVIATQRPSVDVVTGLIKANFPARVCFATTSQVDSRVVLDTPGAEKLLGRGDLLFMPPDSSKLIRAQGCFVSDQEIKRITQFWLEKSAQEAEQQAEEEIPWKEELEKQNDDRDELLDDAVDLIQDSQRASTSYLQRKLGIGYPRAARIMDALHEEGYIGPPVSGGRSRDVLIDEEGEDEAE